MSLIAVTVCTYSPVFPEVPRFNAARASAAEAYRVRVRKLPVPSGVEEYLNTLSPALASLWITHPAIDATNSSALPAVRPERMSNCWASTAVIARPAVAAGAAVAEVGVGAAGFGAEGVPGSVFDFEV